MAFATRLMGVALCLIFIPHLLVADDTRGAYYPIARSLASGNGYQLQSSLDDASRIAPVLPLWLAALMQVTGSDPPLWLVGLFNAAFRAAGVVLLYQVARRYFGEHAARFGALFYLLDPWETLWVGFVLKESLAVPLLLLAVWLLTRLDDERTAKAAWMAGASIGAATLARFPNLVLWAAAFVLLMRGTVLGPNRLAATRCGLWLFGHLSLGMILVLSPWLVRNWQVTGQPVLSTHFAGRKFYTSNGPGVEMERDGYYSPRGIDRAMLAAVDREASPWEREGRLFGATLRHIAYHPGESATRLVAKLVNMWRPTFADASARNWLVLGLPYCGLLLLSGAGIAVTVTRRIPCPAVATVLLVFICVHLVFWGEIRNRQYLMPLLYAFGGLATASFLPWVRSRSGEPSGA